MKLCIHNNSLRLRLSRSDVERLMQTGIVEESTLLGGAIPFAYRLLVDSHAREVRTGRHTHGIFVRLPEDIALTWSSSDQVGITAVERHPGGRETTVLIEKDFSCLKPRHGEGDEDAFPNPAADPQPEPAPLAANLPSSSAIPSK
jgi:hypothetical protein